MVRAARWQARHRTAYSELCAAEGGSDVVMESVAQATCCRTVCAVPPTPGRRASLHQCPAEVGVPTVVSQDHHCT